MKNSLFRYLCLAVALVSCNLAGAQQKANYQLAEKFRLLEQNPIDKYSTEVRPTFINDTDCFYYSFTTREGKKYYYVKNGKADAEIIAMQHSFHGRSMGALAVTGNKHYQEAFGPMIPGIKFAQYNDLDSVKELVNDKTCAIIFETVQGEGGIYPATKEFIEGVRKLCDEKGILLILDEIQCGMGRTGSMFAFQQYGVKPDILTVAKALGCGVPVGAFAATEEVAKALVPGDHGTTYGGNPLACAAATKVFELFEKQHVLDNVREVSAYFEEKLDELVETIDVVVERRGMGLMQGLELSVNPKDVIARALDNGLILFSAGTNVIRFVPPLVITKADVDECIAKLKKSF